MCKKNHSVANAAAVMAAGLTMLGMSMSAEAQASKTYQDVSTGFCLDSNGNGQAYTRYTAREAGDPLAGQATKELITMVDTAGQSSQALLFCLRYDFPTEWSAFVNDPSNSNFAVTPQKDFFPYMVQSAKQVTIDAVTLYAASAGKVASVTPTVDLSTLSDNLSRMAGTAALSLPAMQPS